MIEAEHLLAEPLLARHRHAAGGQMLGPEIQRRDRHGQGQGADLARALARLAAGLAHGETGDQGRDVAQIVAVIQVVDGHVAVIQGGLLDALQPQHLGVEVVVFLRPADAEGDVVVAANLIVENHGLLPCSTVLWPGSLGRAASRRSRLRPLIHPCRAPSIWLTRPFVKDGPDISFPVQRSGTGKGDRRHRGGKGSCS